MKLARQSSCCDRPPDGASATLRTVPHGRRAVLKVALGLGLCFSFLDGVFARAEDPRTARPQEGDQFVFPSGDREGQLITPEDLPLGGPQQLAYPMDLREDRQERVDPQPSAAHPARCRTAHRRDPGARGGRRGDILGDLHAPGMPGLDVANPGEDLFCACHAAQFDPRDHARVVDGPAPRRPPMLPVKMVDGVLTVAGGFTGRVGGERP